MNTLNERSMSTQQNKDIVALNITEPANATYRICLGLPRPGRILKADYQSLNGSCTIDNIKINSTNITFDGAMTVNSTGGTRSATANNVFATDDTLEITLSGVSTSPPLAFMNLTLLLEYIVG